MNEKPIKKKSARDLILELFLDNIGTILEGDQIRQRCGNISEWARRVRELRDEYGYQILSFKDRAELKPGQYLLETAKMKPIFARGISKETRAYVLERNGYTCQMCGCGSGDEDPFNADRKVRLTMGHIIEKSKGGEDTPSNLRAICSNCNEGLQNASPPKPDRLLIMAHLRRATIDDQLHALAWLEKRFAKIRPKSKAKK